ncbi:MAG: hypothetical protein HOO04_10685 [Phycisphaerae bacterium]|nr:hypothetical protein [Phycisphaerae bacterium]
MHPQADLVNAVLAAYFAGSIFEGYMIGRVSSMLIVITLAIVSGQILLDRITIWESQVDLDEEQFAAKEDCDSSQIAELDSM